MSVPDDTRSELREVLWRKADALNWLALGAGEKSQYYENWTKDPKIGGILQRYLPLAQVRVYLKDSILKDYPQARRAGQEAPFRTLGLAADTPVLRKYVKPHGRLLVDGRLVCWGRAADWRAIITAVFERAYLKQGTTPFAAVLTQSSGKFADEATRAVVSTAAKRLGIQNLIWA